MNNKTNNKGKYNGVIAVILVVILIASMLTATIILDRSQKSTPKGNISSTDLKKIGIIYAETTEKAFKKSLSGYLMRLFQLGEKDIINVDLLGASNLLLAMKRAGIGADKVIALASYFDNLELDNPIGDLLFALTTEMIGEDGKPIIGDKGIPIRVINPNANIGAILGEQINIIAILLDIIQNTALTPNELGSFLFENDRIMAGTQRKELLDRLGKNNYITLFADTYAIYSEYQNFVSKENLTLSEGRMAKEMIFELGSRYKSILNEFGSDNIEKLLGLGGDLVPLDRLPEGGKEGEESIEHINAVSRELSGLLGFIMNVVSDTMINLEVGVFDAMVVYINEGDEYQKNYASLTLIKTLASSCRVAFEETGISREVLINKLATINANLRKMEGDSDGGSLSEYIVEEKAYMRELFETLDKVLENEKYANIKSGKDLKEMLTQSEYAELLSDFEVLLSGHKRLEEGLNKAQTIIAYSLLLGILESVATVPVI